MSLVLLPGKREFFVTVAYSEVRVMGFCQHLETNMNRCYINKVELN